VSRPRAVVTDIEGTTTPISFVRDTLFPFARDRLAAFLAAHGGQPDVAAALDDARAEMAAPDAPLDAVVAALAGWIDADRKVAALKTLQGLIWRDGYETGALTAPVYDDVPGALERWRAAGITLAVYSSGSVAAQKLLFAHTDHGDLTGLFSHWFDLATGSKLEAESYRRIAGAIGCGASEILFLSDHPGELDAAREAGCDTRRADRGDPPPGPGGDHAAIRSFAELAFD